MTLTLLDLYNTTASQEWAMYDNDAVSDSEFEDSFVLAINKSIIEILSSYDFPFRERTHLILTMPKMNSYDLPKGIIKRDNSGNYMVSDPPAPAGRCACGRRRKPASWSRRPRWRPRASGKAPERRFYWPASPHSRILASNTS